MNQPLTAGSALSGHAQETSLKGEGGTPKIRPSFHNKKILTESKRGFNFLSGSLPIMPQKTKYTCSDYRTEMRLLGLKKRLNETDLSRSEKQDIEAEIVRLEKILQMD